MGDKDKIVNIRELNKVKVMENATNKFLDEHVNGIGVLGESFLAIVELLNPCPKGELITLEILQQLFEERIKELEK